MESQELNFAATATGVPSAEVVTVGKAEDSSLESIDPLKIAAIVRNIHLDPDLDARVREFATPDVNCQSRIPRTYTTAVERAGKDMNFEAAMIAIFSGRKRALDKEKNPELPSPSNVDVRFIVTAKRPYFTCVVFGLAEDSTEGSTEKFDVEEACVALAECTSNGEKEIGDKTIALFLSVQDTIETAKAKVFEETVVAAANDDGDKMDKKFYNLIRTIVRKLLGANSFARANYALSVFLKIILEQNMAPIDEMSMHLLPNRSTIKILMI